MSGNKLKKHFIAANLVLIIVLMTLTFLPCSLSAEESASEEGSILEKGKTLNGTGFFSGSLVQVDGTVEGTTFAVGREVRINGIINGDLLVAGQTISVNGKINGNIYAAGHEVKIGTASATDVFVAAKFIEIAGESQIGRDLFTTGQRISLYGKVGRNFSGSGEEILVSGSVGEDAELEARNIMLSEGALINGDLKYQSQNQADVVQGAKINGETDWQKAEPDSEEKSSPRKMVRSILFSIFSALLIWFLIKIWRPALWTGIARSIEERPLKTLGIGLLAFLVTPLLAILLGVTIIGLPLGIILLLLYAVTLYLSKIIVAVFLGSRLAERFGWIERHKGVWPVLLSLTVLVLLGKVPVLGILVWLLVAFAGLGSLVLSQSRVSS